MSNPPRALMLFAAGFGTRMGALTRHCPKPLLPVAGRPLIDRALDQTAGAGIETIVANLHYRADLLQAHLSPKGITCLTEAPDILDTGGGLRAALPHLGPGPVFTLNCDAVYQGPPVLRLLAEAWDPVRMDALLLTVPLSRSRARTKGGDFLIDSQSRLTRGDGVAYVGAQIVKPDRLTEIPDKVFSVNRLWDLMIAEGRLMGLDYPGLWCDVGTPEGLATAERMIAHV